MATDRQRSGMRGVFLVAGELSRLRYTRARKLSAPSHFYVLLNISTTKDGAERFEYFVVPSAVVARKTVVEKRENSTRYSFLLKDAEPYRGKWSRLGKQ